MDTLVLILGVSVFLLLIMLFTRPKTTRPKTQPERVRWLDSGVQATFDRQRGQPVPVASPVAPVAAPRGDEAMWERKVLAQLRGDRAAMERMLKYQAKRVPRASRKQLLELVHDDYIRDQR